MAQYGIYHPTHPRPTLVVWGTPKYYGQYGKPGYLEFNISSATALGFKVGDYVQYDRTGLTYKLYSVPEPKRQARTGEVGDAFIYQNLQLFDNSKELENLIFKNLVLGTSGYCFSSRENLSTYEDLDGIIARLQACADEQSSNTWVFQKVDLDNYSGYDYIADVWDTPQEFAINGQSLLEACNQVADVFKGIGWVYTYNSGVNYITFGAPNVVEWMSTSAGADDEPLEYGKGKGLRSLKKYITNKDSFLTRLYAYGSEQNMPPRYYNGKSIVSAESVDIPNLMIPISEWGESEDPVTGTNLPDAAKAIIEDSTAVNEYGLVAKRLYFNSEDIGNIYPTIKGMTVKDVRDYISAGGTVDAAPGSGWSDSQPLDAVLKVFPDASDRTASFDAGLADKQGRAVTYEETNGDGGTETKTVGVSGPVTLKCEWTFTTNPASTYASLESFFRGKVIAATTSSTISAITSAKVYFDLSYKSSGTTKTRSSRDTDLVVSDDGKSATYTGDLSDTLPSPAAIIDAGYIKVTMYANITFSSTGGPNTFNLNVSGTLGARIYTKVRQQFRLILPPFGYNLMALTATQDKVRIAMTSGKCAGREFTLLASAFSWQPTYIIPLNKTNPLSVDLERDYDESLSLYFPNEDYPIEEGDTFVILGVAMPEMYVTAAENRLLAAAQEYYDLNSVARFLYTPELDSQLFASAGGDISLPIPGGFMYIKDAELTGDETLPILVDTVTIQEDESNIPTISCTLRERLNVPNAT